MSEVSHFQLMSKYNSRMNEQVYAAALKLEPSILAEDLGAFFKSISGTLNHILVGDLIWFSRFVDHSERYESLREMSKIAQPTSLTEILFENVEELFTVRRKVDGLIDLWVNSELHLEDLNRGLVYKNVKGIRGHKPFRELLSHVFNHQTHHRGQVSTLLSQNGVDVGVTDFLMEIPDCEID